MVLMVSVLASHRVGACEVLEPEPLDGVKWHPGHYVLVPMRISERGFERVVTAVEGQNLLLGIQRRYTWAALEPAEGKYDFSPILADLSRLAAVGKRLVVQIQTKSFQDGELFAPDYLLDPKYDGGVYGLPRGGTNLRLWNSAVSQRLMALYRAMGMVLDQEPYLEAVVIPETALGKPRNLPASYNDDRFIDNLLAAAGALRRAFPHTVVIQYANYPVNSLQRISAGIETMGVGLGNPDTKPTSKSLIDGVYKFYPQSADIVPLAAGVQSSSYGVRIGPDAILSVKALYLFARERLKVNYLFWLWKRRPADYFGEVMLMLEDLPPGSGGLNPTCPGKFQRCLTQ